MHHNWLTSRSMIITIVAAAAACSDGPSSPLVATRLVFESQPSDAVAGAAIAPAIRIRVLDASGNAFSDPMTVAITLGGSSAATLLGTTSVETVNGVATFADLRIEKAGADYVLAASSGTLVGATSDPFDITHAAPAALRFVNQPALATAGTPFAPAVAVEIIDAHGNRVTTATSAVTIAVSGTNSGGSLLGTTMVNAVMGLATFDRATVDRTGTYSLAASAAGVAGAVSQPFEARRTSAARYCPTEASAGNSFADFAVAVESTEPGGTLSFCDGVHQIASTRIVKSLTITAEHTHKATLSSGSGTILWFGDAGGNYTVRDLNFVIDDGVAVAFGRDFRDPTTRRYDQVLVENNRFTMPPMLGEAVVIGLSGNPGSKASVRGNVMSGGKTSVRVYYADIVDVTGNSFSGRATPSNTSGTRAVDVIGSGPVLIRNNTMTACPGFCILAQASTVEVSDNVIEASTSSGSYTGITVNQTTAKISANVIRGEDTAPGAPRSYRWAGIMVQGAGNVTIIGNSISHAETGISSKDGAATGSDNTVTRVTYAIEASPAGPMLHRSDLTEYGTAILPTGPLPAGMLSCNYWGIASAPPVSPDQVLAVTPHSPVPIAKKPEVTCP